MKTRTVLAASALMLAAVTTAQAQSGAIKGGFAYGNVSNSGPLPGTASARNGLAAGIALGPMKSLINFGAEALFAQRGVESSSGAGVRRLDYIDVPLYLRVSLAAPLTPFAYAGPQVSFEMRCRTGDDVCPDTDRPSRSYSAVVGAGVRLGAGRGISLEGRYIYGLTDLSLSTVTSPDSYRTRSFLVLAGIGF